MVGKLPWPSPNMPWEGQVLSTYLKSYKLPFLEMYMIKKIVIFLHVKNKPHDGCTQLCLYSALIAQMHIK
jgi:hypothetical protein